MDATVKNLMETVNRLYDESGLASELAGWFSVSGDADDFIFYNEDSLPASEN